MVALTYILCLRMHFYPSLLLLHLACYIFQNLDMVFTNTHSLVKLEWSQTLPFALHFVWSYPIFSCIPKQIPFL